MPLSYFALTLAVVLETVPMPLSCFSLTLAVCFRDGNYVSLRRAALFD
jgi:hypothetical protein